MRSVAIIQARMGSSRLPGKVLADIAGKPMLRRVIERVARSSWVQSLAVATTHLPEDDPVAELCRTLSVPVYRGHPRDVLDRYYRCGEELGLTEDDLVVRITADCPLIDPGVVSRVAETCAADRLDYASNTLQMSYPDGLDVEAISFRALLIAWREARLPSEREHVTPYIWKHPDRFRLGNVKYERDLSAMRWTVDEPEDLEFVRAVYSLAREDVFPLERVLEILAQTPRLCEINRRFSRNEGYRKSLEEDRLSEGGLRA